MAWGNAHLQLPDMVTACYSKQQNKTKKTKRIALHAMRLSNLNNLMLLIAPSNFYLVKQMLLTCCWIALKRQLRISFRPSSSLAAKWLESRPLRSQTPLKNCSHQRSSGHSLLYTLSTSNAPICNLAVIFLPTRRLTRSKPIKSCTKRCGVSCWCFRLHNWAGRASCQHRGHQPQPRPKRPRCKGLRTDPWALNLSED